MLKDAYTIIDNNVINSTMSKVLVLEHLKKTKKILFETFENLKILKKTIYTYTSFINDDFYCVSFFSEDSYIKLEYNYKTKKAKYTIVEKGQTILEEIKDLEKDIKMSLIVS